MNTGEVVGHHLAGTTGTTLRRADLNGLAAIERVLLTSDGTLTDMLEMVGREPIVVLKLRQQGFQTRQPIRALGLAAGAWLVDRRVLLQGARTSRTYVYATSFIVLDRLDEEFRRAILTTDTPLGRLWKTRRVETFKEVIECRRAPAGDLSPVFHSDEDTPVLSRTSRVQTRGLAVMLITEHFSPDIARVADRYPINRHAFASVPV